MSIRQFDDKKPIIGSSVYIDESAVVIGDVTLGDDVSVWPTTVIRGDVESIKIGAGTNVQDGAVLHVSHAGPFAPDGQPLTIATPDEVDRGEGEKDATAGIGGGRGHKGRTMCDSRAGANRNELGRKKAVRPAPAVDIPCSAPSRRLRAPRECGRRCEARRQCPRRCRRR